MSSAEYTQGRPLTEGEKIVLKNMKDMLDASGCDADPDPDVRSTYALIDTMHQLSAQNEARIAREKKAAEPKPK
jgi:hypothetical protein